MKQLILKTLPKAKLSKDDFEVLEVDKPKIESGEVLIRNILLSIEYQVSSYNNSGCLKNLGSILIKSTNSFFMKSIFPVWKRRL